MTSAEEVNWQIELAKAQNDQTEPEEPEETGEEPEESEEPEPRTTEAGPLPTSAGADDVAGRVLNESTHALIKPLWVDIVTTAGFSTFGLSWVLLFFYTTFKDLAFGIFGSPLADPIDAAVFPKASLAKKIPSWLINPARLFGRVFLIYPLGGLITLVYLTLIISLLTAIYAAFHPIEFGSEIFKDAFGF